MRVVIASGAGVIRSARARHLMLDKGHEVVNVEAFTHAGSLASLGAVPPSCRPSSSCCWQPLRDHYLGQRFGLIEKAQG